MASAPFNQARDDSSAHTDQALHISIYHSINVFLLCEHTHSERERERERELQHWHVIICYFIGNRERHCTSGTVWDSSRPKASPALLTRMSIACKSSGMAARNSLIELVSLTSFKNLLTVSENMLREIASVRWIEVTKLP